MSKTVPHLSCALVILTIMASAAQAEEPTYRFRYQFHPGETLRWDVVHRTQTRTTISGKTERAETFSKSIKIWRVKDAQPDGTATFEYSIEKVQMRQEIGDFPEVCYNSESDEVPPGPFKNIADSVGVILSTITLDSRGKLIKRNRHPVMETAQMQRQITVALPEEAIPVGHVWSKPQDIEVPLPGGGVRKIKARQTFTLENVKTGVATIRFATQILTPINDPAIESQLIQRQSAGRIRFDIDAGRILEQQMDVDKGVVGFRGPASSVHYLNRFTEKLLPTPTKTASRQ